MLYRIAVRSPGSEGHLKFESAVGGRLARGIKGRVTTTEISGTLREGFRDGVRGDRRRDHPNGERPIASGVTNPIVFISFLVRDNTSEYPPDLCLGSLSRTLDRVLLENMAATAAAAVILFDDCPRT